MSITIEQAEKISEAAKTKAKEIGVPMNIAIVDEGANLKSFHRMDKAWLGSVDISIRRKGFAQVNDKRIMSVPGVHQHPGLTETVTPEVI